MYSKQALCLAFEEALDEIESLFRKQLKYGYDTPLAWEEFILELGEKYGLFSFRYEKIDKTYTLSIIRHYIVNRQEPELIDTIVVTNVEQPEQDSMFV